MVHEQTTSKCSLEPTAVTPQQCSFSNKRKCGIAVEGEVPTETPSDVFLDTGAVRGESKKLSMAPPSALLDQLRTSFCDSERVMERGFVPGNWHVLFGRERQHKEHTGNKRLRVLVANNLPAYMEASSRREKSAIISKVVGQIIQSGGFLKRTPDSRWQEIDVVHAREKVGHSFRDFIGLAKKSAVDKQKICLEAQNIIFSSLQLSESWYDASSDSSSSTAAASEEKYSYSPSRCFPDAPVSISILEVDDEEENGDGAVSPITREEEERHFHSLFQKEAADIEMSDEHWFRLLETTT